MNSAFKSQNESLMTFHDSFYVDGGAIMDILFSLIITCFCYLFIPFSFILIGKKQSNTILYLISSVSLIIGMILMMLLALYLDGYTPSGGGALLWTLIGNYLMKRKIGLNQESRVNEETTNKRDAKIGFILICFLGLLFIVPILLSFIL